MRKSPAKPVPACTEFVCDNRKLQQFVEGHLDNNDSESYRLVMQEVHQQETKKEKISY